MVSNSSMSNDDTAWKMVDAFLKSQRNNRQHASAMDAAKGKTGEKGCMSTVLWG